jgi:F0F1-type ATP synthase assembly protein I
MEDLKSSLKYISFGFELVGSLCIPAAVAYYFDTSYGNPSVSWIFIVGLFLGLAVTYFRLRSVINSINRETIVKKKDN